MRVALFSFRQFSCFPSWLSRRRSITKRGFGHERHFGRNASAGRIPAFSAAAARRRARDELATARASVAKMTPARSPRDSARLRLAQLPRH